MKKQSLGRDLEKGSQANSTEIFISHRNREGLIQNAMEAIDRATQGTYDPSTVYQFPNINQMMIQKRTCTIWRYRVNRS